MSPLPLPEDIERHTLFSALIAASRRHGTKKVILEDSERTTLTYQRLVLASMVIGAAASREARPGEAVGILLPNVNGFVATLMGLNAFGRVAALLNFTAGPRNIASAVRTGVVGTVLTSRRFIDTAKLDDVVATLERTTLHNAKPVRVLYLEDLRARIGFKEKLAGALRTALAARVHARHAARPAAPAVILFTSGTEGVPKGVVLSSTNLIANAAQIFTHAGGILTPKDIALNPLPMFHSFGLTAGTLMPLLNGMKVVLYPSPLHYRQVPKLARDTKATLLLATDTFLQGYARAADDGDLASIRHVVAGAERIKDQTRALWGKTSAILLEGYGATECSPVISCNLPHDNRPGSVGTLLPGMETRLDPVEGITEGGRLHVRGPNVMLGYMLADNPGVVVPPEGGWHDTGDIVSIEHGFLTIRGRAKRFAKIGGEMVSLAAVESLVQGLWADAQHVVVSIPDQRKGESLVLVTDKPDADKESLLAYAREAGLPELWVPKAILVVNAIPVLGSGKVDLPATFEMARSSRPLL